MIHDPVNRDKRRWGAMMRGAIGFAAFLILALCARAAMAQAPDCRILLMASNTAQHPGEIVVAPSAAVTLEAHCAGTAQPTYLWSTGQAAFSIGVNAPAAAGAEQAYTVDVTANGVTRQFAARVRSAAAGTPGCALSREPATPSVRVFTTVRITAVCAGATSYQWTGGYDLRGQGTSTVTHVNVVNQAGIVAIDVMGINANGPGPATGLPIFYDAAPPSCRIVANPSGRVEPNTAVTLVAECDGSPTSYSWAHGAVGALVIVNPAVTASYTVRAANAAGFSVAATHTIPVSTTAPGLRDFTGHWWGGTTENGWGMTLNQHGDRVFGVVYFYDATGEPTWAVMPGGTWNSDYTSWTADVYSPTGSPYSSYDPSQLVAGSPTGTMTLTFANPNSITASYRLGYSQWSAGGVPATTYGQKALMPLILNSGANPSGLAVPDMWWGGPAQNGWGMSVNQRDSEVFAAWYTYGEDRRPTWFIVTGNAWTGNTLSAPILRVRGSPWLGVPYDPNAMQVSTAGQSTMSFNDASSGSFAYATGAANASKPIVRQPF